MKRGRYTYTEPTRLQNKMAAEEFDDEAERIVSSRKNLLG